jgi:hypothetical protein
MNAVEFIDEWRKDINDDLFVNTIYCNVDFCKKGYIGGGRAYWVWKTGDELAELEAAGERFTKEFIRGREFIRAQIENRAGMRIVLLPQKRRAKKCA